MREGRVGSIVVLLALSILIATTVVPTKADEEYNLIATLHSPEPESSANFGYSVAVSGDIVVVGEVLGNIEGYGSPGRAYIFTTDGTLLASLQAPEPSTNSWFGVNIAISGDVVVVGEYWADPEGEDKAGRAHIFNSDGNHIAILQAPEPAAGKMFGFSVDTDGEIVLVGELSERTIGGVFRFDIDGNYISTIQQPELQTTSAFGTTVAVSGDIIVAGAWGATVEDLTVAGKAYIFDYEGNHVATLQSPEPQEVGYFGYPVDVSGEIVLVNEWYASVEGNERAGRAHIFDSEGNYKAILQAPEPEANALFGNWLAVSGDIIVVGEPQRDGETVNDGRAYIFDSDGSLVAILQSPEPYPGSMFGFSVAVSEDIVVVGEPYVNVEGESKAGVVHIFGLGEPAVVEPVVEEEADETSGGGIPGFPYESIVTGILVVMVFWSLQKRH